MSERRDGNVPYASPPRAKRSRGVPWELEERAWNAMVPRPGREGLSV